MVLIWYYKFYHFFLEIQTKFEKFNLEQLYKLKHAG
jgi:hypothetical protein